MTDFASKANGITKLGARIAELQRRRFAAAQKAYLSRVQSAISEVVTALTASGPADAMRSSVAYATDWIERWVLFCDTLRQRGNNFLEHERAGKPPLLVFKYETIVDGRKRERPVNYALVRITPPAGCTIDETKRPFVIIDPRGARTWNRRVQTRFPSGCRAESRASGLFRHILLAAGARANPCRRERGASAFCRGSCTAAPQ